MATVHTVGLTPASRPDVPVRVPVLFLGMLLTSLMSMLDQSITATAGPAIIADVGGLQSYPWVFIAYMLTFSVSMPLWGKFGDLFGRKRMYLVAITIFLTGSVACGLAGNMVQLICFRGVQGAGGGAFMVLSMAVIGDLFEPRARARYQGLFAGVFAVANLAGPVLGGVIADTLGWRWVFFVNLPIGLVALTVLAATLPSRQTPRRPGVDVLGALTLSGAVVCIVLLTNWAPTAGPYLVPAVIALVAAGGTLFIGWIFVEKRAAEPIVPLHLFSSGQFRKAVIIAFAGSFSFFGLINFVPLFFQLVAGTSATATGLLFLPAMVLMATASLFAGQRISVTAHYKIFPVLSMGIALIGAVLLSTLGPDTPVALAAGYLAVAAFGVGLSQQVVTLIGQSEAPRKDMGTATSTIGFMRNSGVWFGTAVVGAVLNARFTAALHTASGGQPLPDSSRLGAAAISALTPDMRSVVTDAYAAALRTSFLVTLPVLVIGLTAALLLKNTPLPTRGPGGPGNTRGAPSGLGGPEQDGMPGPPAVPAARNL